MSARNLADMLDSLSRRERQILDILYQRGRASAQKVREDLPESPSYSAVRALLRILEEKGHIRHEAEGTKYVYVPVISRVKARKSALNRVIDTFFEGSAEQAMAALLDPGSRKLSAEELDRVAQLIEQARKDSK